MIGHKVATIGVVSREERCVSNPELICTGKIGAVDGAESARHARGRATSRLGCRGNIDPVAVERDVGRFATAQSPSLISTGKVRLIEICAICSNPVVVTWPAVIVSSRHVVSSTSPTTATASRANIVIGKENVLAVRERHDILAAHVHSEKPQHFALKTIRTNQLGIVDIFCP